MRTLGLSLGLALLCLLRVQAADLGAAELDERKVTLGKGREGNGGVCSLVTSRAGRTLGVEVFWYCGQLGSLQPPLLCCHTQVRAVTRLLHRRP